MRLVVLDTNVIVAAGVKPGGASAALVMETNGAVTVQPGLGVNAYLHA